MSTATDAIRACLSSEWQSTKQISEQVRMCGDPNCRNSKVYRILASDLKYGLVERTVVTGGRSGKTALWRLPS